MLDTIIIRLHNIKKYNEISNYLLGNSVYKNKNSIRFTELINSDELYIPKLAKRDIIKYCDSKKTMLKPFDGWLRLPSHHRFIYYRVDTERDYIEFNYSIPKYLFGHNVAQFTRSIMDKEYQFFDYQKYSYHYKDLFERLIAHLKYFFSITFHEKISKKDIELRRLDFCKNIYFSTKDEALTYIQMLKRIRKKYNRDKENIIDTSKSTALYFRTNQYYFKIYHKGTEFRKNDFNELVKENQAGQNYDLNYLQNQADLIVRYEIEFTNKMMSSLYTKNVFRKNDEVYKEYVHLFKEVDRVTKGGKEWQNADKFNRNIWKRVKAFKSRIFEFRLKNEHKDKLWENSGNCTDSDLKQVVKLEFDKKMMSLLIGKATEVMNEFKLEVLPTENKILEAVAEHNAEQERLNTIMQLKGKDRFPKLSGPNMLKIYLMLGKLELNEIKELGLFNERTMRRYVANFKKININIHQTRKYNEIISDWTMKSYAIEINNNFNLMQTKRIKQKREKNVQINNKGKIKGKKMYKKY